MALIFANFLRLDWLLGLAVLLLAAFGPLMLRHRGASALWGLALALWVVTVVTRSVVGPPLETFQLENLAVWLTVEAVVVLLLARLAWPLAVQLPVAVLAAIALPPTLIYGVLWLTAR